MDVRPLTHRVFKPIILGVVRGVFFSLKLQNKSMELTREEKRRFIIFLAGFTIFSLSLGSFFWPLIRDLQTPEFREVFSSWVASLGFWGVLMLFAMQVIQVVVAVIPGQPVSLIAGAAYGALNGALILTAGSAFATVLIFLLVKKFGIPFFSRFIRVDKINTWEFLANEKQSALVFFVLFLIPGLPKSIFTYMAPLSRLSLFSFTVIAVLGRFPAMFSTTVMGDAAMQGNWRLFFVIFTITAALGILGIQFRSRLVKGKS